MVAKNFNVYFADRQFNIKGMASTAVPFALQIFDDREVDEVETDTTELSLSIEYPKGYEIDPVLDIGFYILYQDEDGFSRYFTVIDYEKFAAERLIEVTGESGNLDLLNSVALPYEADKAYPISHYINKFAGNSGFEIGLNEMEHLSRKLAWEGDDTATKRVLSVCTQFDNAELDYSFEVVGMTVTKKLINIYKKRGKDTGITLRLYKELNEITTNKTIRNLATGLWATGGTPEGKEEPVNLVGHSYDDGRFYVDEGYLLDRQSFAKWNRHGNLNEKSVISKHIIKPFKNEKALTQSELRNRAISDLTKLSEVELNFTVDIAVLPEGIRVGDTLNIASVDDSLFLGARVLQLDKSRSNRKNVATLGEFLIKRSGISQRVKDIASQVGSMKDGDSSFLWVRFADDDAGNGMTATPTDKEYVAVKSVVNQPVPSDDPADYVGLWRKFVGDDGSDKYTWIRYADTVAGTGISASPTGKKYIGFAYNKGTADASNTPADYQWFLAKGEDGNDGVSISTIKEEYYLSASATALLGGSWVATAPTWTSGKYIWTRSVITYTNSTTTRTDPVNSTGAVGNAGDNGIGVSSVDVLYFQSTSATALVGGSWVTTAPTWIDGRFIWSKTKTVYTDNTFKESSPANITGGKGPTGSAGLTTYFYIAWADSEDGKTGFTTNSSQSANKGYLGTYSSTSATQSTVYTAYAWVRLAGAFDEQLAQIEADITAVPKVVIQSTAPRFPEPNMQWWKTEDDVTGKIVGYFKWDGDKWAEQSIQQSLLNIVELNAVEINGSVISGSSFLNYWDNTAGNGRKGITRIENGQFRIDYTTPNGVGAVSLSDIALVHELINSAGRQIAGYSLTENALIMAGDNHLVAGSAQSVSYGRDGITMTDDTQPYGAVNLRYGDLINIPLKNMTAMFAPNWDGYSTEYYPQIYRAGKNIQIFGAMKPNTTVAGGATWQTVLTLPPEYRPLGIVSTAQQGSLYNTFAIQVLKNGEVQVSRHRNKDKNWLEFTPTSWVNVSFSYITG